MKKGNEKNQPSAEEAAAAAAGSVVTPRSSNASSNNSQGPAAEVPGDDVSRAVNVNVEANPKNNSSVASSSPQANTTPSIAAQVTQFCFGTPLRAGATSALLAAVTFGPALLIAGVKRDADKEEENFFNFNVTAHKPVVDDAVNGALAAGASVVVGIFGAGARLVGEKCGWLQRAEAAQPLVSETTPLIVANR